MKRLSSFIIAFVTPLLFAFPTDSQAFFGFFGGGFSFGFGSGWGWGGPGYWYRPWYYPYGRYPYWRYRYWRHPYGYSPYYALPSLYYPYAVTVPAIKAPDTPKQK